MKEMGEGPALDLDGLIGGPVERLRARLGTETARRDAGGDRWLVYERPDVLLRVRVARADGGDDAAAPAGRVASWTASFQAAPPDSAEELVRRLGIRPVELVPVGPGSPLLRAPLPDPATGAVHSLTALRRAGCLVQAAAFDEPPDWLGEGWGVA